MNLVMSWIRVHLLSFARVRGSSKLMESLWHLSKKVQGALQKLLFFSFFQGAQKTSFVLLFGASTKRFLTLSWAKKIDFDFFCFWNKHVKVSRRKFGFVLEFQHFFFGWEREDVAILLCVVL
jgi:hypothetical protein